MDHSLMEKCLDEEKQYQFTSFSHKDALDLGMELLKVSQERKEVVAIEVRINQVSVFKYLPDGTGKFHEMWLKRKSNIVDVMEMSTLRAYAQLEANQEDMLKDWILEPKDYAACGGGFPIRLKGGSVIGSICVSGLPHLKDHAILIGGISSFLETYVKIKKKS